MRSILLIHPDPKQRSTLTTFLASHGFSVEPVADASSAQQALERRSFEFVLLDEALPDLSGIAFTKALRQDPLLAELAIFLMLDNNNLTSAMAALRAGVTECVVVGTLSCMAPERLSEKPYDGKADIYSLGVTLYETLSGVLPFIAPGDNPLILANMHLKETPPTIQRHRPALPDELSAFVMRCLSKLPGMRPSALEFAQRLEQFKVA